jgi:Major intrinsic protein
VLGAIIAGPAVDYAAIGPAAGWSSGAVFAGEVISLAVLMAAVVAFLDRPTLMRWTPAVVATSVAVLIFAGGLTSGGSFNPARQLGPLLFAERFSYLWAYMLGPLVGAVILATGVRALGLPQPLTCDLCGTRPRAAVPKPLMQPAENLGPTTPACQGAPAGTTSIVSRGSRGFPSVRGPASSPGTEAAVESNSGNGELAPGSSASAGVENSASEEVCDAC